MSSAENSFAIGIDVGGTAIKAGVVSSAGDILHKESTPTEATAGVEHVVDRIVETARRMEAAAGNVRACSDAIGVAVAGNIDRGNGVVVASPNLNGWHGVPLVLRLSAILDRPVVLENDANCAAVGEFRRGAGRGVDNMVLLTLGTGIGSGIILDRTLWRGASDDAGELGHTIVSVGGRRCVCGQQGCLEVYASGKNTARRAIELIAGGETSSLAARCTTDDDLTTEQIVRAAADGDRVAGRVWEETCRYLAAACINIQHTLNPDRIVLGGGMSAARGLLREPVVRAVRTMISPQFGKPPDIGIAELGNDAGFVGAALNALQNE